MDESHDDASYGGSGGGGGHAADVGSALQCTLAAALAQLDTSDGKFSGELTMWFTRVDSHEMSSERPPPRPPYVDKTRAGKKKLPGRLAAGAIAESRWQQLYLHWESIKKAQVDAAEAQRQSEQAELGAEERAAFAVMRCEADPVDPSYTSARRAKKKCTAHKRPTDLVSQFNLGRAYYHGMGYCFACGDYGAPKARCSPGLLAFSAHFYPCNHGRAVYKDVRDDSRGRCPKADMEPRWKGPDRNDFKDRQEMPMSKVKAARWFRLAADQGHIEAQFILGSMYRQGQGVIHSDMEAALCYRQAAETGHAGAQFSLAILLQEGFVGLHDVEQDLVEAAVWFGKAANQGYTEVPTPPLPPCCFKLEHHEKCIWKGNIAPTYRNHHEWRRYVLDGGVITKFCTSCWPLDDSHHHSRFDLDCPKNWRYNIYSLEKKVQFRLYENKRQKEKNRRARHGALYGKRRDKESDSDESSEESVISGSDSDSDSGDGDATGTALNAQSSQLHGNETADTCEAARTTPDTGNLRSVAEVSGAAESDEQRRGDESASERGVQVQDCAYDSDDDGYYPF